MKKKINKWIMFLDEFENLPNELCKNVKYRINYEDTYKIVVSKYEFKKPLRYIEVGEVFYD